MPKRGLNPAPFGHADRVRVTIRKRDPLVPVGVLSLRSGGNLTWGASIRTTQRLNDYRGQPNDPSSLRVTLEDLGGRPKIIFLRGLYLGGAGRRVLG